MLNSISKCEKFVGSPPLKCVCREKRQKSAESGHNMKVNFENVIFTNECRVILDGPDGCSIEADILLRDYNISKLVVELCSGQKSWGKDNCWDVYSIFERLSTTLVQKEEFVI